MKLSILLLLALMPLAHASSRRLKKSKKKNNSKDRATDTTTDPCDNFCGSGTVCDNDSRLCVEADECYPSWEENQELGMQRMCKTPTVNLSPPGGWGPVVAASATVQLPIGKRVEWTTFEWDSLLSGAGSWVQKLGGNDYMFQKGIVTSTVVEGADGLLMLDCPVTGEGFHNLLVETFGDKPVTAIALTHAHSDHSGGMAYFREKFPNVRVIGTEYLDHFIKQRELNTAMVPTEIVYGHHGGFEFDGQTFRMVTPEVTGHSGADSYVVTPSRTLHIVDMVDPQRLNHISWNYAQDFGGLIFNMRHLMGEAQADTFDYINPGHSNIAYKEDIELNFNYAQAIIEAYWISFKGCDASGARHLRHLAEGGGSVLSIEANNFFDGAALNMAKLVQPSYKDFLNVEIIRGQCYIAFTYVNHFYEERDCFTFGSYDPILPGNFS